MTDSQITSFLASKKALILDKSSAIRQMLERHLIQLGLEKGNIISLKNFEHALSYLESDQPEIIITEFEIHDQYGLDLIPAQEKYMSSPFEKIFIVVTENANDTAVADAAEEEVDGYLVKPFSSELFEDYLQKIVKSKLQPNEYSKTIWKAKKLLEANKLEDAQVQFELALNHTSKPTLAHYFLGHIAHKNKDLETALKHYQEGLNLCKLHFKCMVGEFLIYNEKKESEKAYQKIKEISAIYPLSPQLLKHAFILCITNFQYKDVETYFDMYMRLDRKPEDLKFVVSQALLTSGKMLLAQEKSEEALSYFLKGSIISGRKASYLNNVVDTLLSKDMLEKAESYIGMFDPEDVDSSLYKQLLFKINSHKLPYDKVIEEGKNLINQGNASAEIYKKVFLLLKTTKNGKLLENLVYRAMDDFPDERESFKSFLPKT